MRGLYTIPAGTPFLDALASGLLAEYGGDPALLSSVRVFLPTRRACQAMAAAFQRVSNGAPLLLPKMEPLGDIHPEDWHEPASAAAAAANLPLPPNCRSPAHPRLHEARRVAVLQKRSCPQGHPGKE